MQPWRTPSDCEHECSDSEAMDWEWEWERLVCGKEKKNLANALNSIDEIYVNGVILPNDIWMEIKAFAKTTCWLCDTRMPKWDVHEKKLKLCYFCERYMCPVHSAFIGVSAIRSFLFRDICIGCQQLI